MHRICGKFLEQRTWRHAVRNLCKKDRFLGTPAIWSAYGICRHGPHMQVTSPACAASEKHDQSAYFFQWNWSAELWTVSTWYELLSFIIIPSQKKAVRTCIYARRLSASSPKIILVCLSDKFTNAYPTNCVGLQIVLVYVCDANAHWIRIHTNFCCELLGIEWPS